MNRDLALLNGLAIAQTFTRGALTVFTVVVALDRYALVSLVSERLPLPSVRVR